VTARWLLLATVALGWYDVGIIWLVHVSYRLWSLVGPAEFSAYHAAFWSGWRGVQPVVFPAAFLTTVGSVALLWIHPPATPAWALRTGVALQVAMWLLSALLWGRWHLQLGQVWRGDGTLNPTYERILQTHWLRVGIVTAFAIVELWAAARPVTNGSGTQ
jgi:hypothetical protein